MNTSSIPLTLVDKQQETSDSYSFYFSYPSQEIIRFKPGQFAVIQVNINGQVHSRAYSICSLPEDGTLQLTIKRVKEGIVSNWFIDHLQPQQTIALMAIEGAFNIIDCQSQDKVLFISAGCGITPVMAMANYLLNQQNKDIHFIHCAKDQQNIIFQQRLNQLATEQENFKLSLLLEQQSGLINAANLIAMCPDFQQRTIFLCGPTGFMVLVTDILQQLSFDMSQFYQESFTPQQEQGTDIETGHNDEMVMLNVPEFAFQQQVKKGSPLLPILEEAGLPIFAACRAGVCGSCRCKVTNGEVESASTMPLTEQQVSEGYRLACSCKVIVDVTLSLKQ